VCDSYPEDLVHDHPSPLLILAILKDALNHTAAKRVAAQCYDTCEEAVQKMHNARRRYALDDLLDDVVAVLVTHTAHDLPIKLAHNLALDFGRENLVGGKRSLQSVSRLFFVAISPPGPSAPPCSHTSEGS